MISLSGLFFAIALCSYIFHHAQDFVFIRHHGRAASHLFQVHFQCRSWFIAYFNQFQVLQAFDKQGFWIQYFNSERIHTQI